MLAGFRLDFIPFKVALIACVIYLAFVGAAPLVVMPMSRFIGVWGISATRWGWTLLNALAFFASFALSWQMVGPFRR
jgi:hypothetical protein